MNRGHVIMRKPELNAPASPVNQPAPPTYSDDLAPAQPVAITKVLFRCWKTKDDPVVIIALFPEEAASTLAPWFCGSFISGEGHGSADASMIIATSRPATPEEYAPIKAELESAPYSYAFKVYQRQTSAMRAERNRFWREFMGLSGN